jgi:uncharacterized protein YbaP (TraB family)
MPLATLLDGRTLTLVEQAGAGLGLPAAVLGVMRPWLAAQALQLAAQGRAGVQAEQSADALLTASAVGRGIEVRHEYATTGAVIEALDSLPIPAQVDYLRWTLDNLDAEEASRRYERWARGDLKVAEAEAADVAVSYPSLHRDFLVPRNEGWIQRIRASLDHQESAFIVVGLGHMLGPTSIPELLAREGLALTRI